MQELLPNLDDNASFASAELFSIVQRLAKLGVWHWNVSSNRVTWSDELYRIYGLANDELEASFEGYLARVHPEDRDRVANTVHSALQTKEHFSFDERIVRPDGEVRILESVGTVVRDSAGKAQHMIGACMDVTERRALQDQLALKDRLSAMGTLTAGIAHELNNPLQYVQANLERLEELSPTLASSGEIRALLGDMLFGVERMAGIVRDLAAHVRFERPTTERLCLAEVVRSSLGIVEHELRHRAQVELTLDPQVYVEASAAGLEQVVRNLITNALQAIPPGRALQNQVCISVRKDKGEAVLSVLDTGVGIPEGKAGRLFDPFYTTKAVGKGTGLGLFLVHRVVAALNGTIEVEPQTRGTRIVVRLPSAERPEVESTPAVSEPARCRILIIDDNRMLGEALQRLLSGHDVELRLSAAEALALLETDRSFDLVFCDLMMPDGLGNELYAVVEQRWPRFAPRFRFITGGASTAEVARFAAEHHDRLLQKPFSKAQVLALLATR